jgi:hypothetical protein
MVFVQRFRRTRLAKQAFLLLAMGAANICGCGAGKMNTTANVSPSDVTGNWQFTTSSQLVPGVILQLGAYLASNNGVVSAEAALDGPLTIAPCGELVAHLSFGGDGGGVPLEGTLADGQLLLTVNSMSPSGLFFVETIGTLSITAQVTSSTSGSLLSGTYSFVANSGSGCGSDSGTVTGVPVRSLAGQWSGTLTGTLGMQGQFQISLNLMEGAIDSFGFPSLTGSATFSGTGCFTTGIVNADQVGPTMGGPGLGGGNDVGGGFITTNDGGILIAGPNSGFGENSTGTELPFFYSVTSGSCFGDQGNGTLSRQ